MDARLPWQSILCERSLPQTSLLFLSGTLAEGMRSVSMPRRIVCLSLKLPDTRRSVVTRLVFVSCLSLMLQGHFRRMTGSTRFSVKRGRLGRILVAGQMTVYVRAFSPNVFALPCPSQSSCLREGKGSGTQAGAGRRHSSETLRQWPRFVVRLLDARAGL